jgi:hypothetical protein
LTFFQSSHILFLFEHACQKGNEHGDSSDSDEESGLAPDECEPLIVAQGLHLQWVLANNSPAANGGGNGGRGSSADAGLPPSYAPFKRMIQMGLPEEVLFVDEVLFCGDIDFHLFMTFLAFVL